MVLRRHHACSAVPFPAARPLTDSPPPPIIALAHAKTPRRPCIDNHVRTVTPASASSSGGQHRPGREPHCSVTLQRFNTPTAVRVLVTGLPTMSTDI